MTEDWSAGARQVRMQVYASTKEIWNVELVIHLQNVVKIVRQDA